MSYEGKTAPEFETNLIRISRFSKSSAVCHFGPPSIHLRYSAVLRANHHHITLLSSSHNTFCSQTATFITLTKQKLSNHVRYVFLSTMMAAFVLYGLSYTVLVSNYRAITDQPFRFLVIQSKSNLYINTQL